MPVGTLLVLSRGSGAAPASLGSGADRTSVPQLYRFCRPTSATVNIVSPLIIGTFNSLFHVARFMWLATITAPEPTGPGPSSRSGGANQAWWGCADCLVQTNFFQCCLWPACCPFILLESASKNGKNPSIFPRLRSFCSGPPGFLHSCDWTALKFVPFTGAWR